MDKAMLLIAEKACRTTADLHSRCSAKDDTMQLAREYEAAAAYFARLIALEEAAK